MKKVILIVTFILAAIIGSFGIIKINEKGNSVSQHYDMNISDDILCDGDEVFEAVKSNAPALSYDGDSVKLGYMSDDLVYREYSWGHCLEKGYEIIIEKENVSCEVENAQTIAIVMNGNIYKEISFDNNDSMVWKRDFIHILRSQYLHQCSIKILVQLHGLKLR